LAISRAAIVIDGGVFFPAKVSYDFRNDAQQLTTDQLTLASFPRTMSSPGGSEG
jgi:hypothetical protein